MSNYNSYFNEEHAQSFEPLNPNINRLEYQLAVFYPKENRFFKLAVIDYRNYRFEVWDERVTRWLGFKSALLFNYTDEDVFNWLYDKYKSHPDRIRCRTKEKLLTWFGASNSRISFMSEVPEELDKGRFGGIYEEDDEKRKKLSNKIEDNIKKKRS